MSRASLDAAGDRQSKSLIRISELLPYSCAPARETPARLVFRIALAMRRHLVRNALDWRLLRSHGLAGEGFHHLSGAFGIGDPFVVELVRAGSDAAIAFAGIDHSGVAAVHQFEEMIFGLSVLARVADQHLGKLRVLNAVLFLAAFAEPAAVEADDRRGTEVRIDTVEAGSVRDRDVTIVGPRHRLRHHHLLVLGRIHIALAAHDQLGPLHRAVAPYLGIIAVIADDQRDF